MTQLTVAWPFSYQGFDAAASVGSWALNDSPVSYDAYATPAAAWTSTHWSPSEISFNAAQAGGTDATASGSTLLANAIPIGGTGTGAAAVLGSILTATASTIDGAGTGAAAITGATLTVTASTIAGTSTGAAEVSGATLADAASLTAGSASVDAAAPGATLTVATLVLDEGPETGTGATEAQIVLVGTQVVGGVVTADADSLGEIVVTETSFEIGDSGGSAAWFGDQIESAASLAEGSANGDAVAAGDVLAPPTQFMTGGVFGDAATETKTLIAPISLMPGVAFSDGGLDGGAFGDTIETHAALIAGAPAVAPLTQDSGASSGLWFPGRPYSPRVLFALVQDGNARGAILSVKAIIIAGTAAVSANVPGRIATRYLELVFDLVPRGDAAVNVQLSQASAVTLHAGVGSGERNLSDEEMLIFAEAA